MKRLYILIPDLKTTEEIVSTLKQGGFKDEILHVVGERPGVLKKAHLHEANILQTSDFMPSLQRGATIGIFFSIVLSALYAYALPPTVKVNAFVVLGIVMLSLVLGAWSSSLVGVSVKNPIITKYKNALKMGQYIIMVDTFSEAEEAKVQEIISRQANGKIIEQEEKPHPPI